MTPAEALGEDGGLVRGSVQVLNQLRTGTWDQNLTWASVEGRGYHAGVSC